MNPPYSQFLDESPVNQQHSDFKSRTIELQQDGVDSQQSLPNHQITQKVSPLSEIQSVWQSKPLKIIQRIAIFITKLKHSSPTFRFKLLKKNIFYMIKDSSSYYQYYLNNQMLIEQPTLLQRLKYAIQTEQNEVCKQLERARVYLTNDHGILLPGDKFVFVWDLLLMLLTIINILYIPMEISFAFEKADNVLSRWLFSTLPSYFFLFDVFLTFFRGYYSRGIQQTSRKKIFWHYVKGELIWDLIVVLPFFLQKLGYKNTNYFMLLRITRVRRVLTNIEEVCNFQEKSAAVYELFCLVYFVILMSHFCACSFNLLAKIEKEFYNVEHTWLDAQNIADEVWYVRYINAMYWTSITAMTVGYGDIVPVTTAERLFVTFITFFVSGIFGYALSAIGSVFSQINEKRNLYQAKIRVINHHIKKRGLNSQLQFKVRKYFEYYLKFKQEEEIDLDDLMDKLNLKLKAEVQKDMYQRYLTHTKFMTKIFSKETITKLCLCIKEKTYSPDDIIYSKDQVPDNLMFVLQGEVQSYFPDSKKNHDIVMKGYKEGYVVGERFFLLDEGLPFCMKANNFVQIGYLSRADFMNILKQDKEQYMKYCQFRDQYTLGNDTLEGNVCEVCSSNHSFNSCPFSFALINKDKCLSVAQLSSTQKRTKKFVRKMKQKLKTPDIRNGAMKFIQQHKTVQHFDDIVLEKMGFPMKEIDDILRKLETERQSLQSVCQIVFNHKVQSSDSDDSADYIAELNIDKISKDGENGYYPQYNSSSVVSEANQFVIKQHVVNKIFQQKATSESAKAQRILRSILKQSK